jgi:eukaryotic-like serine/threonine-protein kinase
MSRLKRFIVEVHRRSLWQVLTVYLVGSWVSIQVVDALTRTAGLPDWVPPFALVLLVIGLPIVMATAVVQEGAPGQTREERPGHAEGEASEEVQDRLPWAMRKHLTWRRAILGGVAAFALLGVAVTGYFAMRMTGLGPVASLVAQGVLEEGEPILLAEFGNSTDEPRLGSVVTDAIRIDLAASPAFSLVEEAQVRATLLRMEREPDSPLTPELAREVAVREGIKAVLEGEVGAAGSGYILTATLRAAEDGRTLGSFRRSARNQDGVIEAIDRLSQDVRERAGESLLSIRRGAPLQQVTTSSLPALERFTEGDRMVSRGNELGGLALLEEAVALDPSFAMAWRKIAVTLSNLGTDRPRELEAVERAYRYRDRLTDRERYLTEALYHARRTQDLDQEVRAYENVLRLDPDEPVALNNLANAYVTLGRLDRAEELYRRAVALPEPSSVFYENLIVVLVRQRRWEEARKTLAAFEEAVPGSARIHEMAYELHARSLDFPEAARALDRMAALPDLPPPRRAQVEFERGVLAAMQGRLDEAQGRWETSAELTGSAVGPVGEHSRRAAIAFWLDGLLAGDTTAALARLDELDLRGLQEAVPPEFRNYAGLVADRLGLGDFDRAADVLARWRTDLPEDRVTDRLRAQWAFHEVRVRSRDEDPGAVLRALDRYVVDARCPWCFQDVRIATLQALERYEETLQVLEDLVAGEGNPPLQAYPVIHRTRARVADRIGDTATALDAYRTLVRMWADPDPRLRPQVEHALARIQELERGG